MIDSCSTINTNGYMANIYVIKQGQKVYVGSTTRNIKTRLTEHKYQERYGFDFNKAEIIVLERCKTSQRYKRENHWIEKFSKKNIVVNKSKASIGPIGFKHTKSFKKVASKAMKLRWSKNRPMMLKKVNAHKTKIFQSKNGKLGGVAKAKNRPWFVILNKNTNSIVGEFQDNLKAAKALGWTINQFCHFKRGNKRNSDFVLRLKRG